MPFPCRRSFAYVQPYYVALTADDFAGICIVSEALQYVVININKPAQAQLLKRLICADCESRAAGDGGQ